MKANSSVANQYEYIEISGAAREVWDAHCREVSRQAELLKAGCFPQLPAHAINAPPKHITATEVKMYEEGRSRSDQ